MAVVRASRADQRERSALGAESRESARSPKCRVFQRNHSDHPDAARACNRFSSVMQYSIGDQTETTRDGWLTVRVATRAHGLVESRVSEVQQSRD